MRQNEKNAMNYKWLIRHVKRHLLVNKLRACSNTKLYLTEINIDQHTCLLKWIEKNISNIICSKKKRDRIPLVSPFSSVYN